MCEKCQAMWDARKSGDPDAQDRAEFEWFKHQFAGFDKEDGALVRFHASNRFIERHGDQYDERRLIVADCADGLLTMLATTIERAAGPDALVQKSFMAASSAIGEMMDRVFWFGVHTAERGDVAELFGMVAEDDHDSDD